MARWPLLLVLGGLIGLQVALFAGFDEQAVREQLYALSRNSGVNYNTLIVMTATGLLGLVSGLIGSFAVLRQRALLGDAAAHAALPGVCIAFIIVQQRDFVALMVGALAAGLLGVLIINWLTRHTRIKSDTAIGLVLSCFFGAGIALQRYIQNNLDSAAQAGIDAWLLGSTAGIVAADLLTIAVVAANVLVVTMLLYKEFRVISFDADYAASQGLPVLTVDLVLMGAIVLTTVIGLPAVGVVMMAALLILPGMAARFWTDRLGRMLGIAGVFGMATGLVGTWVSAHTPDLPAGPVIVLTGSAFFFLSMLIAPRRGVVARLLERRQLNRRVGQQDLLRTLWEIDERAPDGPATHTATLDELLAERSWESREVRTRLATAVAAGDVRAQDNGWQLTDAGRDRAARTVAAHRLQMLLLTETATGDLDVLGADAASVARTVPPELLMKFEGRLREEGRWPLGAGSLAEAAS